MFENNFTKNLQDSEELIKIVKRHPIMVLVPLTIFGMFFLIDFFIMTILLQRGWWGVVIFILILLFSMIGAWRTTFIWSLNAFVLTNQRIMDYDQKGLFHRVVSATNYDKIQDVSYSSKGIWQSMLSLGTIHLQTAGSQANLELKSVGRPEKVVDLINSIIKNYKNDSDDPPPMPTQEFVDLMKKMRESLGEKAVDELIQKSMSDDNEDE
ncbi:PH domain-containing protein [Patescibacteria group bacterium]